MTAGLALAVVLAALASHARPTLAGEPLIPRLLAQKLDPRLLRAVAAAPEDTVTIWVEFADKGERDAVDRAAALERARLRLSPRALARRTRAHVWPLVDERDLEVAPVYLAALDRVGLAPMAVSRWLNRVAVRARADRLSAIAEWPFVSFIRPVERVMRSGWRDPSSAGDRMAPGGTEHPPVSGTAEGVATTDYGRTFDSLAQLGLTSVHDCGYTGAGVLVCVLDDGFNGHDRHEALRDRTIAAGHRRDFVDGDTTVTDPGGGLSHGTLVLGCLAGFKPGAYVGSGFGVELALARTEADLGERPVEMLYWGMGAEWADSLGADIITSSVGYFTFDDTLYDYTYADMDGHTTDVTRSAEIAASKGILVVNAVGNEGNTPWQHLIAPADADGDSVLAIGAVDAAGNRAGFSSIGPSADGRFKPDLVARGVSVPVVEPSSTGAYGVSSGTSFSAPLVAGLAACLMQASPASSPVEIIRAIRETASSAASPDNQRGYGIPDAAKALRRLVGSQGSPAGKRPLELFVTGANPVRAGGGGTRVRFGLSAAAADPKAARLAVVNAQGRIVRELWSGILCPGPSLETVWDGRDGDHAPVAAGVYWIALRGGRQVTGTKIVALR